MKNDTLTFTVRAATVRRLLAVAGFVAAGLFGFGVSRATTPADADALVYTGVLEDAGAPVDGDRQIQLRFFDAASGGNALCDTGAQTVTVTGGRFEVGLPATCAAATRTADAVFVDVNVGGTSLGRARSTAVPYALGAGVAEAAAPGTALASAVAAVPEAAPWTATTVTAEVDGSAIVMGQTAARVRRIGDSVQLRVRTVISEVLAPGSALTWRLPAELAIDMTKLPAGVPFSDVVGHGGYFDGSQNHAMIMQPGSDNTALVATCEACTGGVNTDVTASGQVFLSFEAVLPVAGADTFHP